MIRPRPLFPRSVATVCVVGSLLLISAPETRGQRQGAAILRIGASSALSPADSTAAQEKAALQSLQGFIKEQTGLDNEIAHEKDWRVVVDNMVKGRQHLGVFSGYEFAWARAKCPKLKPLALAVNGQRYPIAGLVTRTDSKAMDFSGVRGQSLALPPSGQNLTRRFVEHEAKRAGKKADAYFSKIVSSPNIEEALDDVVDGVVQAAAIDRIGLEAYRQRKPGRCKQLKEIAHSPPFPPVVVAYYDNSLDAKVLQRFRDGLLGARQKQRGQVLLTFFRLTGFEEVPKDFGRVLTDTHKAYPPDDGIE